MNSTSHGSTVSRTLAALVLVSSVANGQAPAPDRAGAGGSAVESAVARGVEILLAMQEGGEGEARAEWPYEGVYRVRREIPIGYRVGGTGICAMALVLGPGYEEDGERQAAVARATRFVTGAIEHPLMSPDYESGYDVRGWGYCYGLQFLLRLRAAGVVPPALVETVDSAVRFYVDAIEQTEIGEMGGWNYARRAGMNTAAPSPFMTAPTVLALLEAKTQGIDVDMEVVDRAVNALLMCRTPSGAVAYTQPRDPERVRDATPGAIGRMVATESALYVAGRGGLPRVRGAIDSFIVHWDWLDKRRAQSGTHKPPYGVAPYYFYYAHYYVAVAIELLPEPERAEYRRRVDELLFAVRLDDGGWNDRVFERSENYGTAMAIMALMRPATVN
jgi:hypothetical protein